MSNADAKTYGYTRVSTDRQVAEGESLDVQHRTLLGYAMQHGWQLAQTFVEQGVSGSTPLTTRPAARQLLGLLQPGDRVITTKLDRMFRSAVDALTMLADFQARGVALYMLDMGGDVTGNGISKLIFTILSAVAEAERDRTRERIKDVKADQKARGRYLGGMVPFGFRVERKLVGGVGIKLLVPDEDRRTLLMEARRLHEAGASLQAICAALPQLGLSRGGLHRLLQQP